MGTETTYYVNGQVVRLVAFTVVLLTIVLLLTQWEWLGIFLVVDFFIRAFTTLLSPLAALARLILEKVGVAPKPIFAPPKKFAAGLGFVFSAATVVFLHFGLITGSFVVGGILIFCAVLESVFNVCLGCYVYNWIVAPIITKLQKKKP